VRFLLPSSSVYDTVQIVRLKTDWANLRSCPVFGIPIELFRPGKTIYEPYYVSTACITGGD
jgi:hypothetical protein